MNPLKALIARVALALLLPATSAAAADEVIVASKIDTEGALLGNVIAVLLENKGIAIRNKIQLGPTKIVRAAILAGQVDIYPEYTGNGALFFNSETDPAWKDARLGYEKVRALDLEKNNLVWLTPAPANNTWMIAVRRDLAASPVAQDPGGPGALCIERREVQARRLRRVRRKSCGVAGVPVRLRVHADARSTPDPLGREYRGDDSCSGGAEFRGQRRDGLWH